jgi:hemin uptake protein HemP
MSGRGAKVLEDSIAEGRGTTSDQQMAPVGSHPRIRSGALLKGGYCVVIEHGREEYRLQVTRLGKLILTK